MGHRISVFAGRNFVSQPGSAGAWWARLQNAVILLNLVLIIALGVGASAQTITTIAGGGPPSAGVLALSAPVGTPWGVVQDSVGNTYVSDNLTNRVFKIDTSGNFTIFAGNSVPGYSGDNGLATAATLNAPEGLAVDSNNVLYVADTFNHVIRAINTSSVTSVNVGNITIGPLDIATVAGDGNRCQTPTGACGDGTLAILAQLSQPGGVAIDGSGNIYIADAGDNKVRLVTVSTGNISTVAGTGGTGIPTPGPALLSTLFAPAGVSLDGAGNLYIADTTNDAVEQVVLATGTLSVFAGIPGSSCSVPADSCGDGGPATSAQLNQPDAVFAQGSNVFIVDTFDNRIREVATGGNISTPIGNGNPCAFITTPTCSDGPSPTGALFNLPAGIFVNASGTSFWIADRNDNGIRSATASGVARFAGIYFNAGYYGDSGPATSAEFLRPSGLGLDASGNLYLADAENNVVRKITAGTISKLVGSSGALPCFTLTCGDGGSVANATLALPSAVALDGAGNIYIADTQDYAIRVYNTTATELKFFVNTATELHVQPGDIATIAGTISTICQTAPSCGDNGAATQAQLNNPSGLFLDKSGNIYIADTGDNVIRFVNTQAAGTPDIKIGTVSVAPGNIATIAGNYTPCAVPTGPNACGDGASAIAATLNTPTSVFVDTAGNIYISDAGDNRIRVVNPQASGSESLAGVSIGGGNIGTVAGDGNGAYRGDGGLGTAAEINFPGGVFVTANDIFIADQGNSLVRVLNSESGNMQTAVGTPGSSGFSGDGGGPLSALLARPIGVIGDASGNLYISDGSAARIRKVTGLLATPPTAALSPPLGITFASQALATTSAGQPVTVTNIGSFTNLVVSSVTITGANASDFKQTNNCTSSMIPGAFCTITVTFAPTATGSRSATLSVADNATPSTPPLTLTGTAVVPFTLPTSGTPSPASVTAGSSATATVAVTWAGGSTAAVALSCSVAPAVTDGPTCALSPASVTPKNGAANSTLTLTTTAKTSGALQPGVLHGSGMFAAIWLFLPGIVLSTVSSAGSRKKRTLLCVLLTLALAGCIFLVACGGGNSSSNNNGNGGGTGTPSGTYAITVTATSAGAPNQTESFKLTVK